MKKFGQRHWTLLWVSFIGVLAVIPLVVMASFSWSGSQNDLAEFTPRSIKTQTMSTDGKINTATSTRSWLADSTMRPLQLAAPPLSQSPMLSSIFLPLVDKAGNPASFQAMLPLLPNTDNAAPEIHFTEKTILVDISEQHVYAYEKGKLIFSFIASTGRKNLTRAGHYRILDKIPKAFSDPWGFWMPYWMGIYYAGYNLENGFHSLPVLSNGEKLWGDKIGAPITYGCVVLMPNDMKKLYRWASVGTAVVIQK